MELKVFNVLRWLAVAALVLGTGQTAAAQNYEGWLLGATSMRAQSSNEWKVNLGVGLGFAPENHGGSKGTAHFLPIVDVEWRGAIFASTQRGLGINLFRNRQTSAGVRLTFDGGRKPTDNVALAGTATIKPSLEAGGFFVHYTGPWRISGDIRQGMGSGHKGVRANFGVAIGGRLSEANTLVVGGSLHYTSTKFNQAYYTNNGNGFTGAAVYSDIIREIGEGGYVGLSVRVDRLLGQAQSAAFTKDNQYFAGLVTGVRF